MEKSHPTIATGTHTLATDDGNRPNPALARRAVSHAVAGARRSRLSFAHD